MRNIGQRGKIGEFKGQQVGFDDNKSPTDAFLWCNALARPKDVQFNHVYPVSHDPESYTCLANICMGPAFIAKLTDTHKLVRRLLEYRSFELYGWQPAGRNSPTAPPGYDDLKWADPLPPVFELREKVIRILTKRPKDRTVQFIHRLGLGVRRTTFYASAKPGTSARPGSRGPFAHQQVNLRASMNEFRKRRPRVCRRERMSVSQPGLVQLLKRRSWQRWRD